MVGHQEESPVSGGRADLSDEIAVGEREVDGGDAVGELGDGEFRAVVGGQDEGRIELEVCHGNEEF